MKKFFNFRMVFAALATLAMITFVSCSEGGDDTPTGGKNDSFTINEQVQYNQVSIEVTPPSGVDEYFLRVYRPNALPADLNEAALITYISSSADFAATIYEGEQTIPFAGLVGNSNYVIVYFGWDSAKSKATTALMRKDIRTPEAPQMYDIEVLEKDVLYAKVKVTPQDNDKYYSFIVKKSIYEKNGGDDYGMILAEIGYWDSMAEMFKEYGLDYTWFDVYNEDELVAAGTREYYSYDVGAEITWGTEYIAYAFSFDEQGNVKNHMVKEEFATESPVPSNNTFTCTIDKAWESGVRATITPSNNDPYFVSVENYERFVSFYEDPENGYTYEDMLRRIMEGYSMDYLNGKIFTGTTTIDTRENLIGDTALFPVKSPNMQYCVVVVGFENGPTTDYKFFKFRSEGTLEE